ncbi:hypothetical protein Dsin_006693 [Dipteronia sinensis]|uniref:Uncharacterized protein n=1 Tax=Dipteronia sinensis TaxID=43782 RepID=A0AAE0AZ57_9ROSI|nr:hypothetical protein Dsin_006693 [Dipteronia sinensis]
MAKRFETMVATDRRLKPELESDGSELNRKLLGSCEFKWPSFHESCSGGPLVRHTCCHWSNAD